MRWAHAADAGPTCATLVVPGRASAPPGRGAGPVPAGQVTAFLVRQSDRHSAWHAKAVGRAAVAAAVSACGGIAHPLGRAVSSVPGWKLTTLSRAVDPEQVGAACPVDRAGAHGRRDYAIVLLLARLGLRAGEVSAIELDDLDWRAGELTVRGKGGRREVLPLPVEVGQALADYVRHGRPHCPTRQLYVSVRAPFIGPAGGSVFAVVAAAAGGPVSPRSGRTGCGTRWPTICFGMAPR